MKIFTATILILSITAANIGLAHSGGTDKYGCHAGSQPYHCHGGSTGGGSGSTGGGSSGGDAADAEAAYIFGGVLLVGLLVTITVIVIQAQYSPQFSENTEKGWAGLPAVDALVSEDSGGLQLKWFW